MTEYEFGPKMLALSTDKQRRFVMFLAEHPLANPTEAARAAGYSDASMGAKVTAHHLMHDQKIIDALHEQAGKKMWALSLKASHTVEAMLASDDQNIALKAAVSVLDRTGFGSVQNINVNQTVTDMSGRAIMDRIRALAEKHGLDQQKLLGRDRPVVDAEFSEVSQGEPEVKE